MQPSSLCVFVRDLKAAALTDAGGLNLADPEFTKTSYDASAAYRASKQANRMQAAGWAAAEAGAGITFASCHPGVSTSNVSLGLGFDLDRSEKSQMDGALTPIFLATTPASQLTNGGYYADSSESRCEFCGDKAAVTQLFDLCERS